MEFGKGKRGEGLRVVGTGRSSFSTASASQRLGRCLLRTPSSKLEWLVHSFSIFSLLFLDSSFTPL